MSERLTVREACRRRMPLDGCDAQGLEHALTITERERDEARSVLMVIRSWRRATVGLEPRPTIDAETLDRRIAAVLDGPPYREKDPSDPLRIVRALAKAERERDDARAEIQRLKAENERLRERLQIDPGGSDRIDELEQALQFVRRGAAHNTLVSIRETVEDRDPVLPKERIE